MKKILSLLLVIVLAAAMPVQTQAKTKSVVPVTNYKKAPKVAKGKYTIKMKTREDSFIKFTAKKSGWQDFVIKNLRSNGKTSAESEVAGIFYVMHYDKSIDRCTALTEYDDDMKVRLKGDGAAAYDSYNMISAGYAASSAFSSDHGTTANLSVKMKKGQTVYISFWATEDKARYTLQVK